MHVRVDTTGPEIESGRNYSATDSAAITRQIVDLAGEAHLVDADAFTLSGQ
jgi:hypothetical protein